MTKEELTEKIQSVISEVTSAAAEAGHPVTLLAATKTRTPEEIRTAISAGILLCGENRAEELVEKVTADAYQGARLDYIGTLQSNKVKLLVGKVSLIHSLSTVSAARQIEKLAGEKGICQDVLLELHLGEEVTKSGLPPTELGTFLKFCDTLPHLHVKGLMAVPPVGEDPRRWFAFMHEQYEFWRKGRGWDTLSMGMSGDWREAIKAGSNLIRLGSSLFGPRDYGPAR